eukprot:349881_1
MLTQFSSIIILVAMVRDSECGANFSTGNVSHLEPVINFQITFSQDPIDPSSHSNIGSSQMNSGSKRVNVSFEAFGENFNFSLKELLGLYSDDFSVNLENPNGSIQNIDVDRPISYSTQKGDDWCSVTPLGDGTSHGAIFRLGKLYTLDPLSWHEKHMDSKTLLDMKNKSQGSEMVIYLNDDVQRSNSWCQLLDPDSDLKAMSFSKFTTHNKLLSVDR